MEKKEKFERVSVDVIKLNCKDIVATSGGDDDNTETEEV